MGIEDRSAITSPFIFARKTIPVFSPQGLIQMCYGVSRNEIGLGMADIYLGLYERKWNYCT